MAIWARLSLVCTIFTFWGTGQSLPPSGGLLRSHPSLPSLSLRGEALVFPLWSLCCVVWILFLCWWLSQMGHEADWGHRPYLKFLNFKFRNYVSPKPSPTLSVEDTWMSVFSQDRKPKPSLDPCCEITQMWGQWYQGSWNLCWSQSDFLLTTE